MPLPSRPVTSDRGSWHRRAARPVSVWMLILIVVVLIHPFIPQARWLMVHMVTLGLITTSIMVWGQHFTEALLKTRLADRKSTRLNSSHVAISYAVFCLKKKRVKLS